MTTHVLDLALGRPAEAMELCLWRLDAGGERVLLCSAKTNSDGRTTEPLATGPDLKVGVYELVFQVGSYLRARGLASSTPFLDEVPIRFGIADPADHYHIPLLMTPWGYSTYRGT